jgi:predicted ArsR family transcriptional regulator
MTRVTDEEIITAFRDADVPVLVARDLAEEFDISPQAINERLHRLNTENRLGTRKVGGAARVWWIAEEESEE